MKTKVIEVENVTVKLNNITVVEDVTFSVEKNEFFGIIGPNGGGKTTLLKTILGLIPIEKGRITLLGQSPHNARYKVGYVPQFGNFDMDFPASVMDVVLMGRLSDRGILKRYSKPDIKQAETLLDKMGLLPLRNKPIGDLSGGQRQRVLIARSLVSTPELLILDEPTASVDSQAEESLYELLHNLNKEITIVMVTHDIGVISSHITSIACINKTLFCHSCNEIPKDVLQNVYGCPVDLIAHGVPHRVLSEHGEK